MVVVISRKLPLGTGHCIINNYYFTLYNPLVANLHFYNNSGTRELDAYSAYALQRASGVGMMISWDRTLSVESPPFQRREAQAQKPFHRNVGLLFLAGLLAGLELYWQSIPTPISQIKSPLKQEQCQSRRRQEMQSQEIIQYSLFPIVRR
jgi:hypothetical protein